MGTFRQENNFLFYAVSVFGLYLKSIEKVTNNKWLIAFFTVWTKVPITIVPIYIMWDVRALIFDEAPLLHRLAMGRKVIGLFGYLFKLIMFYMYRNKFEDLIDLWDNSFKKEFYPEAHEVSLKKNRKENISLVRSSLLLGFWTAFFYSVPAYFSKKREMIHPSGILYPRQSPDFELVVTFDVWVSMNCVSDTLAHMINELHIDDEGRLLGRQNSRGPNYATKRDLNDIEISVKDGEFDENGYRIENYEEIKRNSEKFRENMKAFESKLKVWILHHQETIRFFDEIKKVYSPLASVELGYVLSYTALTALHLLQVKPGFTALGIILVASINLLTLFLWSKLGGDVGETFLFEDAFSKPWFLYPAKTTKDFVFIIMRCKKPLILYGMRIYKINLVTFFEILKLSYQFYAFMVQLTD